MPKMSIYQAASGPGGVQQLRTEVGWNREGTVQVGTTKLVDGADPTSEYLPAADGQPPRPAWEGWNMDLDRGQINQLIRVLREARDKAFGRDE